MEVFTLQFERNMASCVHREAAAEGFFTPSLNGTGTSRRFPYQSVWFTEADAEA